MAKPCRVLKHVAIICVLCTGATLTPSGEEGRSPHQRPSQDDITDCMKSTNTSLRNLARLFAQQRDDEEKRQHMRTRGDIQEDDDPVTVLVAASPKRRQACTPKSTASGTYEAATSRPSATTP